jgi:hypothetical protein
MENCIKEQYSLFAGRVSTATLRANQLRLYLSAAAYVLMSAVSPARPFHHGLGTGAM